MSNDQQGEAPSAKPGQVPSAQIEWAHINDGVLIPARTIIGQHRLTTPAARALAAPIGTGPGSKLRRLR